MMTANTAIMTMKTNAATFIVTIVVVMPNDSLDGCALDLSGSRAASRNKKAEVVN